MGITSRLLIRRLVQLHNTTTCIVCDATNVIPIARLSGLPVETLRLWRSREAARRAVKAPIDLALCRSCGHLFNASYRDDFVQYEEDYENSQIFSRRFQRYAQELARRLAAIHALGGKTILEIGGGQGDFLKLLCEETGGTGICVGPSYEPKPDKPVPENIRFIKDYYTERYRDEPADLVLCRHVLEHFSRPRELVDDVYRAVRHRPDLPVYFEVPNAEYILRERATWEIIYQHCSYFTKPSLARLFEQSGFVVHEVAEQFDGQFLAITATAARSPEPRPQADDAVRAIEAQALSFARHVAPYTTDWLRRLHAFARHRQRVVAWGAGAKAVSFLNTLDAASAVVSHVVDVNPRKAGRFIAGTGQEIIEPERLPNLLPDIVIAMNRAYADEIREKVAQLGLMPDLIVA